MPLQYFFPKDISLQANHLKGRWMVKGRHSKRKGNFHIILRNASLLQRQKLDKSRSTGSLLESRRQQCVLLSFAKLLLLCIVFSPKLNCTKKKTKILKLHQSLELQLFLQSLIYMAQEVLLLKISFYFMIIYIKQVWPVILLATGVLEKCQ